MPVVSERKLRANRRNARRSTGPRTAGGKRRSSLNAATHGIFCKDAILPGEDKRQYVAFRNLLLDSPGLKPQTWLELSLADQFVLARWKLRRAYGAERVVHGPLADALADVCAAPVEQIAAVLRKREEATGMRRSVDDALDEAERAALEDEDVDDDDDEGDDDDEEEADAAAEQRAVEDEMDAQRAAYLSWQMQPLIAAARAGKVPPAVTMATTFAAPAANGSDDPNRGAFERLGRYQHRLELSAQRAMRELRQLRKDLGVDAASLPTCPFLEEIPEDEQGGSEDESEGEENGDREEDAAAADDAAGEDDEGTGEKDAGDADADAPVQNEPTAGEPAAGDAAAGSCDAGSRRVEPVEPTKRPLRRAPDPRGGRKAGRDRP